MREAFLNILNSYLAEKKNRIKGNTLADFLRHGGPGVIRKTAHISPKYLVHGSAGQGNWAEVPWIGIFDKEITASAERGYYIVYLFDADMKGVYLSLNQGWTQYEKEFKPVEKAQKEIKNMALHYRELIRSCLNDYPIEKINLHAKNILVRGYELGHICGKYYTIDAVPKVEELVDDLRNLIGVYRELKGYLSGGSITRKKIEKKEFLKSEDVESEESEEERKATRLASNELENKAKQAETKPPIEVTTKHYPRDPYVAAYAKRRANGKCDLCENNAPFISKDGAPFLECHHIMTRAEDGPDNVDNAVALCPNCHRKIHNLRLTEDIEKLKIKASLRLQ